MTTLNAFKIMEVYVILQEAKIGAIF